MFPLAGGNGSQIHHTCHCLSRIDEITSGCICPRNRIRRVALWPFLFLCYGLSSSPMLALQYIGHMELRKKCFLFTLPGLAFEIASTSYISHFHSLGSLTLSGCYKGSMIVRANLQVSIIISLYYLLPFAGISYSSTLSILIMYNLTCSYN